MKGKFIQNGVHLAEHEWYTIKLLLEHGYNIELVPASQIKGQHLPDVLINSIYWEIKAPKGKGKNTIKHNLLNADKQGDNVIIDLHRCGLPDELAIKRIRYEFSLIDGLKRAKIITKNKEILEIP